VGQAGHDLAGGREELDWTLSVLFDAMGDVAKIQRHAGEGFARAHDRDRDGFVTPAAPAYRCWKSSNAQKARGAKIYAEVVGYGATSVKLLTWWPHPARAQCAA
jgi:3-oxoacyl-[acyl-carrier-protein] synthase-1